MHVWLFSRSPLTDVTFSDTFGRFQCPNTPKQAKASTWRDPPYCGRTAINRGAAMAGTLSSYCSKVVTNAASSSFFTRFVGCFFIVGGHTSVASELCGTILVAGLLSVDTHTHRFAFMLTFSWECGKS